MTEDIDIDVRPVAVDRLIQFQESELVSRRARIDELLQAYETRVAELQVLLEKAQQTHAFLQREHANVILGQRMKAGDVVRVVCGECQGTGMKPTDVMSGRIKKAGAFESVVIKPVSNEIDPEVRCTVCEGKRWVLMDRFKG